MFKDKFARKEIERVIDTVDKNADISIAIQKHVSDIHSEYPAMCKRLANLETLFSLLTGYYRLQVVDVPGTPEQITPAVPPSKRIEPITPIQPAKAAKGGK